MIDTTQWKDEDLDRRVGLMRLVIGILFGLSLAAMAGALATVLVIVAVLMMIVIHELGHFVTAKAAGMKVTEFFVGFGQRLWSVRKGETEYGVKLWPLGGYCKIPGMTNLEEIDPEDEPRTYRQQSFPRRLSVAVAGSVTHFVLAFLLLFTVHVVIGFEEPLAKVGELIRLETGPSPAQEAGLQIGDEFVSVDGRPVAGWDEIPQYIRSRPGEPIHVVVRRDGREVELTAVPLDLSKVRVEGSPVVAEPTGFIGIGPAVRVDRANPIVGIGRATKELGATTVLVLDALRQMASLNGISQYREQFRGSAPSVVSPDEPPPPRFLSPIGLVRVAGSAAGSGLRTVMYLLISINIFVGIFNMIPLLPLDGGHVAIAVYERIRSRRGQRYVADVARLMPAFYLTLFALGFLAISSIYLDIVRPLNFQ